MRYLLSGGRGRPFKDPFSLTVMLCALFVVKGTATVRSVHGFWPRWRNGYRDRNFWRYSQFAAKGRFCKRIWFPFGRNESEQNEDDGPTRSETREIQVVCFAYIFSNYLRKCFLYFVIQTRATDQLSLFVCGPVHAKLPAVGRKRHEAKVARMACVAGRRKGEKSKWAREGEAREGEAREGEGTACKDAIVYFVFFVHQTNVKILIGQI